MGALCVTYCVGGLSVCNSIAGAYAEKSPVVMITGSPGLRERIHNPLLHHMVRDFRTQYDVFEKLCVAGTELSDPLTAFSEIDRVLATCARYKRPVYIEIPRDMVHVRPETSPPYKQPELRSDTRALAEAVDETVERIENARQPVLLLGVEIHRFGLQEEAVRLAEESGIPMAATMLGKGVVAETHPLYMGLYEGALGRDEVTKYVEASDCVLMLGTFMTDINLGIYTAELDLGDCIYVTSEAAAACGIIITTTCSWTISCAALAARHPRPEDAAAARADRLLEGAVHAAAERPITVTRLIDRLDEQLEDGTVVIADVGDALFGATELTTRGKTEFISPAYYTSMGFAVPAALGVHVARPGCARRGDRRRRRVPDDRHGALEPRAAQVPDRRHRARQRGLRHRAAAAPRRLEVQRHPALAVPPPARGCSAAAKATSSAPKANSTRRSTPPGTTAAAPAFCKSSSTRKIAAGRSPRLAERMSKTVVQK